MRSSSAAPRVAVLVANRPVVASFSAHSNQHNTRTGARNAAICRVRFSGPHFVCTNSQTAIPIITATTAAITAAAVPRVSHAKPSSVPATSQQISKLPARCPPRCRFSAMQTASNPNVSNTAYSASDIIRLAHCSRPSRAIVSNAATHASARECSIKPNPYAPAGSDTNKT